MVMAAPPTATCGCKTTVYFRLSEPKSLTHKFPSVTKRLNYSNTCKYFSYSTGQAQILLSSPPIVCSNFTTRSVSSTETPIIEEDGEGKNEISSSSDDKPSASVSNLNGCQACGKSEIERGCNGEGRIQGGIATVPGFGWWPIKAYRPCPAFVQSGGRYRRTGQSMDEVVSGKN